MVKRQDMEEIDDREYIEVKGNHCFKDMKTIIEPDLDDSKTVKLKFKKSVFDNKKYEKSIKGHTGDFLDPTWLKKMVKAKYEDPQPSFGFGVQKT